MRLTHRHQPVKHDHVLIEEIWWSQRSRRAGPSIRLQTTLRRIWFLSTRYSFGFQTGQITADQEAYIDKLAANHGLTGANDCKLPMKPSVDLAQIPLHDKPDYFWVSVNHVNFRILLGQFTFWIFNFVISLIDLFAVSVNFQYQWIYSISIFNFTWIQSFLLRRYQEQHDL